MEFFMNIILGICKKVVEIMRTIVNIISGIFWQTVATYMVPLILLVLSALLKKNLDNNNLIWLASASSVFWENSLPKQSKLAIFLAIPTLIFSITFEHLGYVILNIDLWNIITPIAVLCSLYFIYKEQQENIQKEVNYKGLENEIKELRGTLKEMVFKKELEDSGVDYDTVKQANRNASESLNRDLHKVNIDGQDIVL